MNPLLYTALAVQLASTPVELSPLLKNVGGKECVKVPTMAVQTDNVRFNNVRVGEDTTMGVLFSALRKKGFVVQRMEAFPFPDDGIVHQNLPYLSLATYFVEGSRDKKEFPDDNYSAKDPHEKRELWLWAKDLSGDEIYWGKFTYDQNEGNLDALKKDLDRRLIPACRSLQ